MKASGDTIILISEHLPVVGESHPLRAKYSKFLLSAAGIAAGLHLLAFGGWFAGRVLMPERQRTVGVRIVKIADLGVPPSLSQRDIAPQVAVGVDVTPPSIGVPEPVPDFEAPNLTLATQDQMTAALAPTDLSSLGEGGGDSIVVQIDTEEQSPSPDEFVAVEELPVLISMPTPLYPELARSAQMEGTVSVRALIGKDGRVKDAFVTEGVTLLNESALAAARQAVFKPALQQHRPVEVWVQIPIRFRIR